MRWFDDVRFGAAAAMFMVEGMCQGPLGANWGDGFAHSSDAVNILTQSGIPQGDPNPFFQKLMVRSLKMIESTSTYYIWFKSFYLVTKVERNNSTQDNDTIYSFFSYNSFDKRFSK